MRICLVGDYSPQLNEGYKNIAHSLSYGLEIYHKVFRLHVGKLFNIKTWVSLKAFSPQVIHILSQPTIMSLLLLFSISFINRRNYKLISALRFERLKSNDLYETLFGFVIRIVQPDLVLVQSSAAGVLFSNQWNCNTNQLPNGVDLQKFYPVTEEQKLRLRGKYCLDPQSPTILHVGHPIPERNLSSLEPLIEHGFQVIMVASKYLQPTDEFIEELRDRGFVVIDTYLPNVEELYQLADCYIFPVNSGNSISMPLSILEALACDLPVVSTRFDAIHERFGEGTGIYYIDSEMEIIDQVENAIKESLSTRSLVEGLSWEALATTLSEFYQELANK